MGSGTLCAQHSTIVVRTVHGVQEYVLLRAHDVQTTVLRPAHTQTRTHTEAHTRTQCAKACIVPDPRLAAPTLLRRRRAMRHLRGE
eukprot:3251027-Rhodomonas_salina.2